ncbi:transposase [Pirellula sp. SH-Sr6A]|uniref:transposase n=1 Tax=Pirellula sp. SH-Sr6A TaxID=1632865 RepID=UPI00143AAAFD|nr:transposase [Pirellula sp. SH-Sr6A]
MDDPIDKMPDVDSELLIGLVEAASRRFHPLHGDEIGFFHPSESIAYLDGNLPHWRQDGVTYFVTYRTADSIPQEKLRLWLAERDVWLRENPEPHSPKQKKEYWKLFPKRMHDWLDAGYGECLLKDAGLRQIVVDGLLHFAGNRYLFKEWVVMPNHVHGIVTPMGEHQLSGILHSWKSFTAKEINKRLGRQGSFWHKESFDHIVRSAESLERIGAYIAANPDGLPMGSYSLSADAQMRRDAASTVDEASSLVSWLPTEEQSDK